ncbi:GAF and ANTAR domain-containing protein [Ornithinimicrobium ciconiae]|uniref:GAF and ANTAR domain-containing protein n=1 Tax=Ornithinimicrobium ciconiae TaxID=2594265 RepID=A0A516G7U6_9MICO|nr:GAF and ANTAR domain-containing protein [Ornithinimicrobium ciconiae]QDO87606.1 GAF and ANTAR domain-containing protein [Ornithinimicrobium ciconiae]
MTLERVAVLAVEVVPSADAVGISLRQSSGMIETAASTGADVMRADELQYGLDEGPCLDSIRAAETYVAHDTRTDRRWPRWGPLVADLGFLSVLSVQLVNFEGVPLGALNLYARQADVYTEVDVDYALVFAHHASGAIEATREIDGLRTAMHSRHVIGVAQGMLMQRYGLTVDSAFEVLLRRSQETNTKLRDIANLMVTTGRIPDSPILAGEGGRAPSALTAPQVGGASVN